MAESKKTAIQLLEEISLKQDSILGHLKNIDFSQKVLLKRLGAEKAPAQAQKELINEKIVRALDQKIEESDKPVPRRREPVQEKQDLVNVYQKIITDSGGPIFLAYVEFLDENGDLVKKTRTDNNGQWKASLTPGIYTVSVTKRANPESGKTGFSLSYQVGIPKGEALVALNDQVIRGK